MGLYGCVRQPSRSPEFTPPFYDRVLPGNSGSFWVQHYKHDRMKPDVWVQINAAGKLVGKLALPRPRAPKFPVRVPEFTKGAVLLEVTDDDGASHVQLFRLTLAPGH